VPPSVRLPEIYIEPADRGSADAQQADRARPKALPVESRMTGFMEVEQSLLESEATREAARCLRCDLEFTQPQEREEESRTAGGELP